MLRGSNSKSSYSGSSTSTHPSGSSLLHNLKKIANSSTGSSINKSDISAPQQQSSTKNIVNNDPKPLNARSTLNTQNLSQYINVGTAAEISPQHPGSSHTRTPSTQSSTKYSYSRRSSNATGVSRLSRQHTNQSISAGSVFSQGSSTNLLKYVDADGNMTLDMPRDPHEIESLFEELMYKRNILQALSPDKQRDLMNYNVAKKWMIVKQDLLNEIKKLKANNLSYTQFESLAQTQSATSLNTNSIRTSDLGQDDLSQ